MAVRATTRMFPGNTTQRTPAGSRLTAEGTRKSNAAD